MKSYISILRVFTTLIIVSFVAFSCKTTSKDAEDVQSSANTMVMQVGDQNQSPQLPEEELSKEKVCMVNNAYMGKKQIPVAYDNKTYYGCCEMCVDKIKNNKAIRYATDPYTGKAVDKATAFIALNPTSKDGSVMYFENKESFRNYKAMSLSN